jgi:hypothetical protein
MCGARIAPRDSASRNVCTLHSRPDVKPHYIDDGFDRIAIYAAVMARALGEDDDALPLSAAYLDMVARSAAV